jgi:hypothetical protein
MRDHVAVGVACETARGVEAHTAEQERDTLRECVRIDAEADSEVHSSGSWRALRRSNTVTVS